MQNFFVLDHLFRLGYPIIFISVCYEDQEEIEEDFEPTKKKSKWDAFLEREQTAGL